MNDEIMGYEDFVRLVIAALEAAGVAYMIGGAVAAWAWGEPCATLDLDLVVNIPLDAVDRLSEELEKRDMLVPAEMILDNILESRSDLPVNAIHMYSGYKADLYPLREGDELDFDYIDDWVNQKGLTSLWGDLLARIRAQQ